jgi:hypothetical protein
LRVHAKTPSISEPARSSAIVVCSAVATGPS